MLKRTFLAAGLLLALTSLAQTKTDKADVNWGPELNDKTDGDFVEVTGMTDDAVFQLMRRKKEVFLQRMDLNMKAIYQKPIDLELDKKDLSLEGIHVTKERIIVFTSFYDKKNDQNDLYMRTYDPQDFSPKTRIDKIARIPAEKAKNKGGFHVHVSPDDSKVLVEIEVPREKGAREKFIVKVFDAEMQQLWERDCVLPFDDNEFRRERVLVDNDGSLVVVGVRYTKKGEYRERKRDGQATYDYHLLVYKNESEAPQDHLIEVGDKALQDMTISLGTSGDILCAGLFGDKGTIGIRGSFFLKLDRSTKKVTHQSFKDFDHDFITAYMTEKEEKRAERKAERKDKDLGIEWDYDLREIIHREDGGAILMAEEYYMYVTTSRMSTGNGGYTTVYTYHYVYNDIIAVNIDPSGNIEWAAKVPKRQHSTNDGGAYSSYAIAVKGDNIYLVFDDTGENLFLKPGDKVRQFELTGKDALVVLATIDGDGHVTREALFSPERREAILRPKDCVQLQNDDMFIYASRKKEYRFGMIRFD